MRPIPNLLSLQAQHSNSLLDEVWRRFVEDRDPMDGDLTGLSEIHELDASCLPLRQVDDFASFQGLRYLDLSLTEVEDLSPLALLPDLKELHLTFHRGNELKGLEKLTQLHILDISYPRRPILSLDRLSHLESLEELYLNGCGIRTVAHLVPLEKLKMLTLSFNPIPKEELIAYQELMPNCALLT